MSHFQPSWNRVKRSRGQTEMVLQFLKLQAGKLPQNCIYRISSYNCRGDYSFLNSSSEETIQGEETNQGRKLYEEIR